MKRQSTSLVIVNTTVASKADARKLAGAIVASRLAACVQYLPIHSVYRWKGKLESNPEYLLWAKTRLALTADLMAFIKRRHPYTMPEILAAPVAAAYGKYREWVAAETKMLAPRTHGKTAKQERKPAK